MQIVTFRVLCLGYSVTEQPGETQALAERLRAIKAVEDVLVFDVARSDAVLRSVDKVWH